MTEAALDLRAVALLIAASAAFTLLSPAVFRRDPTRRKLYLATLAVVLAVVPWWTLAGLWTWPIGVNDPRDWLAQPVPTLLLWGWWLIGGALMARTLLKVATGRCELARLPEFRDTATIDQACTLAGALRLAWPVAMLLGPSPCASTLGRNLLVLPAALAAWPPDTRRAVLAHELAHIHRHDDRWLLLVRLLVDWYWWLPWLRRLHSRYQEAMEESCDDAASRLLGDRSAYVAGLVDAARRLTRPAPGTPLRPAWVSLVGQSHLTVRAERLLTRPRPTLDHADGRWALLSASLVLALLLTARPAAIPDHWSAGAALYPLYPAPAAGPRPVSPRIEVRSYLQDWRTGGWQALPGSARDPLPVYPAAALAGHLQGTVVVELEVSAARSGWHRRSTPQISSSDPSGLLAAAVRRALARGGADLSAGLSALSGYNNDIDVPPPGTRLRLRRDYRFVLADEPAPDTPGSAARPHEEVEP